MLPQKVCYCIILWFCELVFALVETKYAKSEHSTSSRKAWGGMSREGRRGC